MAVALAFGVLFATAITLALVPSIHLILEDFQNFFHWLYGAPEKTEEQGALEAPDDTEPGLRAARSPVRQWPEGEGIGAD